MEPVPAPPAIKLVQKPPWMPKPPGTLCATPDDGDSGIVPDPALDYDCDPAPKLKPASHPKHPRYKAPCTPATTPIDEAQVSVSAKLRRFHWLSQRKNKASYYDKDEIAQARQLDALGLEGVGLSWPL